MPQAAANTDKIHEASHAPEYPPGAGAKTSTESHGATETANEARAGVTGHNVNIVLVVSTLAAFAGVFIVWAVFFAG
jgi:hypothetical protein